MRALIILLIVIILIIAALWYFKNNKKSSIDKEKEELIEKIYAKYGSNPNFEGTKEGMMEFDIFTLRGLLDGTIK